MGQLVDGVWHDAWYETKKSGGAFVRSTAKYRDWVTPDGAPGPSGEGGFAAESGRYHLYVSNACPWAHRTLIFREIKGLADHVTVDVVHPDMLSDGWSLADDYPGATGDRVLGKRYLREVYTHVDPKVSGRVTVPIIYDKARGTIVYNDSSDIMRM